MATDPGTQDSSSPNPVNTKLEDLSATQTPAITTKQEPISMEVHHHPKVEKKNFKEYFLEFLMIFLAVTMGFFGENIRENISENRKAKEYAESLYKEVYSDSVKMQAKLALRNRKEEEMGYFRKYVLDSNLTNLSDRFYPSFAWSFLLTTSIIFEPNDGILSELKSSGAQRYFKSISLQNMISSINIAIANVRNRNSQEYSFVEDFTRPFTIQYYDFKWQDSFTQNGKLSILEAVAQTDFHPTVVPVINNLAEFKRERAEGITAYYLVIIRATRQLYYKDYAEKNHMLLEALRKEYHLE